MDALGELEVVLAPVDHTHIARCNLSTGGLSLRGFCLTSLLAEIPSLACLRACSQLAHIASAKVHHAVEHDPIL